VSNLLSRYLLGETGSLLNQIAENDRQRIPSRLLARWKRPPVQRKPRVTSESVD